MTRLLKPVHKLSIGIIILLLAIVASGFAEEIRLGKSMPDEIIAGGFLGTYIQGGLHSQRVVTDDEVGTCRSVEFVAPESGNILITWYPEGVYVMRNPNPSDLAVGSFGLFINVVNTASLFETPVLRYIKDIGRFASGDIPFPPIVEKIYVTRGNSYLIQFRYIAENFNDNCEIHLQGNSGGGLTVVIEYLAN